MKAQNFCEQAVQQAKHGLTKSQRKMAKALRQKRQKARGRVWQ